MSELSKKDWLEVFTALENENRYNIVMLLKDEGEKSFTYIQQKLQLSPGNCAHHMNVLFNKGIVFNSYITPKDNETEYSFYELTDKAKKALNHIFE